MLSPLHICLKQVMHAACTEGGTSSLGQGQMPTCGTMPISYKSGAMSNRSNALQRQQAAALLPLIMSSTSDASEFVATCRQI